MEYNDIKNLIDDVGKSKIDELNLEFPDGVKINIKKNTTNIKDIENQLNLPVEKNSNVQNTNEIKLQDQNDINYKIVKSPMVGTFYSKSSPTSETFVKVGDKVKKGDVLCIVEAMKLMNEIESEFDGEIAEICCKDEDIVEYGMTLFKII